jgi:hypothetical protein
MKYIINSILIFGVLFVLGCHQSDNKKDLNESEQIHGRIEIENNPEEKSELFYILKEKDSLMFELSFNQLDTRILEDLATEDVEFYHDQGGATYTKQDFIDGMKRLGDLSYNARRELIEGSTEVYPLYKDGALYGAILRGDHRFFAKEPNDTPEYLTSTAKYTTLWMLIEGEWKMSRIYSFDHQAPVK